jgi:hypothetical protein
MEILALQSAIPDIRHNFLYKTALCDKYVNNKPCKAGVLCWNAHGVNELRYLHISTKTTPCKFASQRSHSYLWCPFSHPGETPIWVDQKNIEGRNYHIYSYLNSETQTIHKMAQLSGHIFLEANRLANGQLLPADVSEEEALTRRMKLTAGKPSDPHYNPNLPPSPEMIQAELQVLKPRPTPTAEYPDAAVSSGYAEDAVS